MTSATICSATSSQSTVTRWRDWIHVEDHCAGIIAALFEGKPESLISYVTDRLGHDRRYAIDSSFAQRELKWKPRHSFKEGLEATID
jgi:dTDP-glucose 4,6-dehydratase